MSVRTTVVGSWWPRPAAEDDLRRVHRGELSEAASRNILDRCAAEAIADALAVPDADAGAEAEPFRRFCHLPGMGCSKAKRAQEELLKAAHEAVEGL